MTWLPVGAGFQICPPDWKRTLAKTPLVRAGFFIRTLDYTGPQNFVRMPTPYVCPVDMLVYLSFR
jgi:hypothetical protein